MRLIILILSFVIPIITSGQQNSTRNGLVFGGALKANGIRFNFWDKDVQHVNGANFSFKTDSKINNGLSFGLIANQDSKTNGIKIGGLVSNAEKINGLCFSGLYCHTENHLNGLILTGLLHHAREMNGLFISFFGAFGGNGTKYIYKINGVNIGMFTTCENMNGVSFGFQSITDTLRGIDVGFVYTETKVTRGVQIGMHNKTQELHGIQIGFWNVAENNTILKKFPFILLNLKKRKPAGNNGYK